MPAASGGMLVARACGAVHPPGGEASGGEDDSGGQAAARRERPAGRGGITCVWRVVVAIGM